MRIQSLLLFVAGVASSVHDAECRLSARKEKERSLPGLTVMTRNLYLGASLTPLVTSTDLESFVSFVTTLWHDAFASDFDWRMEAIAKEIDTERPDLVGLQEAFRFTITDQHSIDGTGLPLVADLSAILLQKLKERGLSYSIASRYSASANSIPVQQTNASGAPTPGCNAPIPGTPGCLFTIEDFDIILVNDDAQTLELDTKASSAYDSQLTFTLPTGMNASFQRGWTYVEGVVNNSQQRFRFVNTHLESSDVFNAMQAGELVKANGPADVPDGTALVLLGDFNSAAEAVAFEPGRVPFGSTAFQTIMGSGLKDAWLTGGGEHTSGNTFGQNNLLDNRQDLSYVRIDLVFTGGNASTKPGSARVVGQTTSLEKINPPYRPSDHLGVVATIVLG